MARKKGGKSASQDNTEVENVQQQAESVVDPGEAAQQEQQDTPVEDLDVEQLRNELNAARQEIVRLKSELAKASTDRDAPLKGSKPQEVQDLQEKLQRLRKEQQEADAARDKAWKQLKAVVQEISSLANPVYLQSLQVKTQE